MFLIQCLWGPVSVFQSWSALVGGDGRGAVGGLEKGECVLSVLSLDQRLVAVSMDCRMAPRAVH